AFEENGMMIFDLDVETPKIQGDVDRLLRDAEQLTLRQSLELDQKERELAHQRRMEEIEQELHIASAETDALKGQLVLAELGRTLQQNLAQVENRERVEEIRLAHKDDQQTTLDSIAAAELARDKA